MFNPIKYFKEKRERKRRARRLEQISSVFGSMERLLKSGLLYWDPRHRRLFIAEPLALVMLARGAQQWADFLNNVYQYVAYVHMSELWQRKLSCRQSRAVAQARRSRPALAADELQCIRRAVVAEMSADEVSPPKIEPIEFYVVADSKDAKAETTLCGTYNPDTDHLDMALWDDVQAAVAEYHK